ncbi:MAG: hypothetical protein ABI741_01320 [Ferruginibacter sp.]
MLQVNDDINDELFRRAADSYPLRTDNPDWDAVLNKMKTGEASGGSDLAVKKSKHNYRWLLLLLLLIPVAIFEGNRSFFTDPSTAKNNGSGKTVIAKETNDKTIPRPVANNVISPIPTSESDAVIRSGTTSPAEPTAGQTNVQKNNVSIPVIAKRNNNAVATGNKHGFSSKQRTRVKIQNAQASADDAVMLRSPVTKDRSKVEKNASTEAGITSAGTKETLTSTEPENKNEGTDAGKKTETVITSKETVPADKDKALVNEPKPKQAETAIEKNNKPTVSKDDKKEKARTKRFYAGLIAAPDFSAIKLQSMKKVGFNYGLLLGYKLTNKLSIETGLLQDKKYYSTNGKYFSTKNIYLPPNANIEYVDGVCKMLEWPINISYTFSKRSKSSWFGSLGVTSYFMQHESYTYDMNYSGYRYPKAYDYSNKSTSLAAIVNVSAGYTYKLGRIGDLRFEPYIKLPVNKIGTGKLPIQSGGIFIGFTKLIF